MAKLTQSAVRQQRTDARQNRERILTVARQAFGRFGTDASLDEIAAKAQVGPGTLYRHFPTRDTLIEAVYQAEIGKLAAAERKFTEDLGPVSALRAWMVLFVDLVAGKQLVAPPFIKLVRKSPGVSAESGAVIRTAFENLTRRAIKSGKLRKDLEPLDLARALIGTCHDTSGSGWHQSAKRLVDILIAGARAER
jgi:AcrR family transcriptional regulator